MFTPKLKTAALASVIAISGSMSANAAEMLFYNDFESGLGANESVVTNTGNFGLHHQSTNPYAGGNGSSGNLMKWNPNMSGQVMGTIYSQYNNEASYYQIDNITLDANKTNFQLMFEFDSWIESDAPDGFAVAISADAGSNWSLLNPNAQSDMVYDPGPDAIGVVGTQSAWDTGLPTLNALTGQGTNVGDAIQGFDGWDSHNCSTSGGIKQCDHDALDMAGTAMFDIAGLTAGSTISLRFAFASDNDGSSQQAEGINIDKVKVTGECITGNGPNCDPMGGTVPEPGSLALAMIGMAAVYGRRKLKSA